MADSKSKIDTKEEIDLEKHIEEVLNDTMDLEQQEKIQLNIPKADIFKSSYHREDKNTIAVYPYTDEEGNILYEVLRRTGRGQPFLIRSKNKEGDLEYKLQDNIKLVPYNLPAVKQAIQDNRIIWITEGESKADALNGLGFVATSCVFKGPEKWYEKYNNFLEGAESIIIIQDNDNDGERFAESTVETILNYMQDIELSVLKLFDLSSSLKEGGDIEDLIAIAGKENVKMTLESFASDFKASV